MILRVNFSADPLMADENTRSRGTVRWFDDQKGFGFISPDDGGEDLFVHQSAIRSDGFRTLQEGQGVEFLIALENDRTKAVDVTGPDGSSVESIRKDGYGGGRGDRSGGYGFHSGGGNGGFNGGSRGSGRSGGGNAYRGGAGAGGCYICGESGHLARDCRGRESDTGSGGDRACYACGEYGHLARDCNLGRSGRASGGGGACYNCGGQGHMARECPNGGRSGGSGSIDFGRFASRVGGGGFGRFASGGGGGSNCYNCGEQGHFTRECPTNSRN
ncbi:hypothetical protein U1Q18_011552 [Sarracenia purpurea var. burkii]